jgi:hypothetical protein
MLLNSEKQLIGSGLSGLGRYQKSFAISSEINYLKGAQQRWRAIESGNM